MESLASGIPPIVFIFCQNLGWERENHQDCTAPNASPCVCCLCFVFIINISYIDLLYFENLLSKTPDLCNLRTFLTIFVVAIYALFRQFLEATKTYSAKLSTFRMYGHGEISLHAQKLISCICWMSIYSQRQTGKKSENYFGWRDCFIKSNCELKRQKNSSKYIVIAIFEMGGWYSFH